MSYPPSAYKTWTSGEILTAADLNNTVTTINNSNQTEDIDDYSTNATEMRVNTDPYPAAAESLPTSLSGELERIRYIIKQITGKSQWYVDAAAIGSKGADVASAAALPVLTDGNFFDVTGTTAITSINTLGVGSIIHLQFDASLILTYHSTDLVLPDGKSIQTKAGDVATFFEYASGDWICVTYSRSRSESLVAYRRPNLVYVSATQWDVEANTGTSNQTTIVFPDGDTRSVTEDTASTHKYRRGDITADAEFNSGTEDSGLRAALSEATDTWYAIYAVKSVINSANFVLVGDTTLPLQANFATLNTAYQTNGWVYLGLIRNGSVSTQTGDIVEFVQCGNETLFYNANDAANLSGFATATPGLRFANTAGATSLAYTYSAGTGSTSVPGNIGRVLWNAGSETNTSGLLQVFNSGSNRLIDQTAFTAVGCSVLVWIPAAHGSAMAQSAGGSITGTLMFAGWIDNVLGIGGNPVL